MSLAIVSVVRSLENREPVGDASNCSTEPPAESGSNIKNAMKNRLSLLMVLLLIEEIYCIGTKRATAHTLDRSTLSH
jgi:hypothetical protein